MDYIVYLWSIDEATGYLTWLVRFSVFLTEALTGLEFT